MHQDPQNGGCPIGWAHITHLNSSQPAFMKNTCQGKLNVYPPTQLWLTSLFLLKIETSVLVKKSLTSWTIVPSVCITYSKL